MKFMTMALSLALLVGCNNFDAIDTSLTGIEGSYLLKSNHVSNTKTISNPNNLCDALTLDDENKPTEITGYVISDNREIATLYFDPEQAGKFKSRVYIAKVEMDGKITRYENTTEDFISLSRNAVGQLVLRFEDASKNLTMDSIPLDEVEKIRGIIGKCKASN